LLFRDSIGIRALLLFGTEEQKKRWLPPLVRGEQLAAFALTEPEAGSDASTVQTTATPTPDGKAYVLNGTKRWITNGGIAQVLTVMARTPGLAGEDKASKKKEITAFLVTPDMPGFEVVEARMSKNSRRPSIWASTLEPSRRDCTAPARPSERYWGPLYLAVGRE
jgi:alkylation response protein AidB-like acyl-CoA dehydrogenase